MAPLADMLIHMRRVCQFWGAVTALLAIAGCEQHDERAFMTGVLTWPQIELRAPASETITEIMAAESSTIQAGEVVLQLDDQRMLAVLRQAEAQRDRSQSLLTDLLAGAREEELDAARAEIVGIESQLALDTKELTRIVKLRSEGQLSVADLDRAQAKRRNAEAQLQAARARLALLQAGSRQGQIHAARQARAAAEEQVEQARIAWAELTIRAPVTGYLDDLLVYEGDRPRTGETLAVLLTGERPFAQIYIPERELARIAVGQRVELTIDGLDERLAGHVRWISREAVFTPYYALTQHDRGHLSFVAEIDLESSADALLPPAGIPVEARFP